MAAIGRKGRPWVFLCRSQVLGPRLQWAPAKKEGAVLARTATTVAVSLVAAGIGRAQWTATQEAKLIASDEATDDYFGSSVSRSGDTVVIGAFGDDHMSGVDAGSAYVFVRSGASWTEQTKLTASDAGPDDNFGSAVSLSGDTAV